MITVVYLWHISLLRLPQALWHMAIDRLILRRNSSIGFYKSIGTGTGETFTPRDADPTLWGLIITIQTEYLSEFDESSIISSWRSFSKSEVRYVASPLSAHGLWSGVAPFKEDRELAKSWSGKVLAITRAQIVWHKNFLFWRAVPPVITSLRQCQGVESAFGIGEAPIGLQGTLSIWSNGGALRDFAYNTPAHVSAINQTQTKQWYSEELFARFALLEVRGSNTSAK